MLTRKSLRLQIATIGLASLSALVLMASGCGGKNSSQATAPGSSSAVSTNGAPRQAQAAIPANEKPFVAPDAQGPPSGSQFVTRGGQVPSNGSQP